MALKVYLDTCCYMRPLDDHRQLRIAVEAEAVVSILQLCISGQLDLISSEVIELEVRKTPNLEHRDLVLRMLQSAKSVIRSTPVIQKRAKHLESFGLNSFDAYHLASAEAGGVNFFATCDDKLHKKALQIPDLRVQVETMLSLVQVVGDKK